ncbi:MAG: efflux transporter outer membrane subunit [Candidatus Krumholzibacteria bacterium]|nr:efflux transporter outer membrane subunit [Candidatus Krumholzibacteria bacterium]
MTTRNFRRQGPRIIPVVFCGMLLLLAGCAVGPDYEIPELETVPDAWQNAAAADVADSSSILKEWWTAFGDTLLDTLMVRAQVANLDAAQAIGRIREARAYHQIAGGDYYPQIGLDGSWTRTEIGENTPLGPIAGIGGGNPSNNWEFGLGASWEIDVFGRIRRTREATGARVQASIEDYRDVMVSLQAEVAVTYVDVRTTQLRLIFAQDNVDSQRETMDIVTAREDAGLVPLLDVTRARSNLANTEAAIPLLEMGLEVSLNRMAILLGQAPGSVDSLLVSYMEPPQPDLDMTMSLPAELLRRRPDVRRSERELAAQTAMIGVATADLYPSFSLSGIMTLQASEFGDLGKSGHFGWSLVPGLKWDLFSGGKIRGKIKAEEAKTEQLLAGYEKTVLNALAEVENTLVALKQEDIRRGLLQIAVDSSQQSVELVHTQYVEGLTDFQSYLDAQRVLFEQQDSYASSRGQVFANIVNLNRALGGGWSLDDLDPDIPGEEVEDTVAANDGGDEEEEVD